MRYWFHTGTDKAFALDTPPPDGQDILELTVEQFAEIQAAIAAATNGAGQSVAVTPPPQPQGIDMERFARIWRKMEAKMKEIQAAADAEIEPIKKQQDQVSDLLMRQMNLLRADKLETEAGVVCKDESIHANAADWGAIWSFVEKHGQQGMIQKRLNTSDVLRWARAHATKDERGNEVLGLPPGMNLFTKYKLTVRKPGGQRPLPTDEGN
jgi:hypothetical protein